MNRARGWLVRITRGEAKSWAGSWATPAAAIMAALSVESARLERRWAGRAPRAMAVKRARSSRLAATPPEMSRPCAP